MHRPARTPRPTPQLIATTEALDQLCRRLAADSFVTVDTEFMRERTYFPELCVVQLAGDHEVAVIDAQADGIDLTPMGELLANQAVLKVFHAARQDIEIFVLRFGAVPTPLFDTQIAAMVAGFGDQVSYEALVSGLTGGSIDKAHRFSDWSARPLSAGADRLRRRRRHPSARRVSPPECPPGRRRPDGMGGAGDGRAHRPRALPRRSGNRLGAAASAQQQPALPRPPAGPGGMARDARRSASTSPASA